MNIIQYFKKREVATTEHNINDSINKDIQENRQFNERVFNSLYKELEELKKRVEQLENTTEAVEIKRLSDKEKIIFDTFKELEKKNKHTFKELQARLKDIKENNLRVYLTNIRQKGHTIHLKSHLED